MSNWFKQYCGYEGDLVKASGDTVQDQALTPGDKKFYAVKVQPVPKQTGIGRDDGSTGHHCWPIDPSLTSTDNIQALRLYDQALTPWG